MADLRELDVSSLGEVRRMIAELEHFAGDEDAPSRKPGSESLDH